MIIAALGCIILCLWPMVQAANILVLHPVYCGSHEFVLRSLGDHLISKGHSVTQVHNSQRPSHYWPFFVVTEFVNLLIKFFEGRSHEKSLLIKLVQNGS